MQVVPLSPVQLGVQGSMLVLLALLLRKSLQRVFQKRVSCLVWLVVLFRFVVPWGLAMPVSLPVDGMASPIFAVLSLGVGAAAGDVGAAARGGDFAQTSGANEGEGVPWAANAVQDDGAAEARAQNRGVSREAGNASFVSAVSPEASGGSGMTLPGVVWLAGTVVAAGYFLAVHLCSIRRYGRGTVDVTDAKARKWLLSRRGGARVRLVETPYADGPMTYGLMRPVIAVPLGFNWGDWPHARLVLEHEYAHVVRHDAWMKSFGLVVACLYWFDPLVWVALSYLSRDLELACDEEVAQRCGPQRRKAYAHLILDIAQSHVSRCRGFATMLAAGSLEERIVSIMDMGKKISGCNLVCAAFGIALLMGTVVVTPQLVVAQGEREEGGLSADEDAATINGAAGVAEALDFAEDDAMRDGDSDTTRLVVRHVRDEPANRDVTELWTPCYSVKLCDDALARGYEWGMDEGELYEQVKDYATDVLAFHSDSSAETFAAVFCAPANMRATIEEVFAGFNVEVVAADSANAFLRVYALELPDAPKFDWTGNETGFLYGVTSFGLNGEVYGLGGHTDGAPGMYGAVSELRDSGLIISSSMWKVSIPRDLVSDSVFDEGAGTLFYPVAGQGDCVHHALRLPMADGWVLEVYCADGDDVVWSDYLGERVKVGPVSSSGDLTVMVGVYTLDDLNSSSSEPADEARLEELWQQASSWVSARP